MNVASLMTTDVDSCTPESTCKEVAIKMKELDVGVIPICENEKLVGIITDRDLVIKGLATDLSDESPVSELITNLVVKGTKDMSIEEAAKIMSHEQIRRLPIVENEKLVGMVSLGDLAVNNQSSEKAGEALKDISVPSEPNK
ncbi:CBS domain-containing protein [Bacillus sp. AFS076308]|uniref:CBS domain-containing protein n=1 Tax=Bacillus sp. AFS076308 TaxID=2033512 RepID=UPI000BF6339F|nr:CBS domain-containing protein [Bacillus sp. AFS076308]PFN98750.1 CBS domain-containing protein [Bacillus sp. AFS076308]